MIDGLVTGSIVGVPTERVGASGRPYVQCRLRAATGEETVFVLATAFDADVRRALMALSAGDPVSVAGELKVRIWTPNDGMPKPSITMIANALVSPYSVRKKRQAAQASAPPQESQRVTEIADDILDDAF